MQQIVQILTCKTITWSQSLDILEAKRVEQIDVYASSNCHLAGLNTAPNFHCIGL
jgi:hypothetical protein